MSRQVVVIEKEYYGEKDKEKIPLPQQQSAPAVRLW